MLSRKDTHLKMDCTQNERKDSADDIEIESKDSDHIEGALKMLTTL